MRKVLLVLTILLLISAAAAAQAQATEDQAREALLKAEEDVAEMAELGLGIAYVNDSLNEARRAFDGVNYTRLLEEAEGIEDEQTRQYTIATLVEAQKLAGGGEVSGQNYAIVVQNAGEIAKRKERAYLLSDSVRALELRIEEMLSRDLETGEAEVLLERAHEAFEKENYGDAEDLIFQANSYLNEVDAEATLLNVRYKTARENAVAYFNRYKEEMAIAVVALFVLSFIVYSRVSSILMKRKLEDLGLEKQVLGALIKKAQIDHFRESLITRDTYDIKVTKYKERIVEIERTIPVLEARLKLRKEKKKEIEISPEELPSVKIEAPQPKKKTAQEEKVEELETELKEREAEIKRISGASPDYEKTKRLEGEVSALRKTLEGKAEALTRSEEDVQSLKARVKELEEKPEEKPEVEGLKTELEKSKLEQAEARAQAAELEGRVKELEGELKEASGRVSEAEDSEALKGEVDRLAKMAEKAGEEKAELESRIKGLEGELEDASALKGEIKRLGKAAEAASAEKAKLKGEVEKLGKVIEGAGKEKSELVARVKELETALKEKGKGIAQLQARFEKEKKVPKKATVEKKQKAAMDVGKRLKLVETERNVVLSLLAQAKEKGDGMHERQYTERLAELESRIKELKLAKD